MLSDRLQTAFRAVERFSVLAFTFDALSRSDCITLPPIMYFIQKDEAVPGCLSVTRHLACHSLTSSLSWIYPYFSSQTI